MGVPPPLPPRNVAPSIPPRNSSIAPSQQQATNVPPFQPKIEEKQPKSEEGTSSKFKNPMGEEDGGITTLENRANNLLIHRRKLYLERAVAAKGANDRTTAGEALETVKLFNQALGKVSVREGN